MHIDWTGFTPVSALTGGFLIGAASALFLLLNGRIAGISGIVGGLLRGAPDDARWRLAFVGGLMLAPVVYGQILPVPVPRIEASFGNLVVAGLLVGVGTRYGSGCTSGHGVCGLARLAPRSIAATATFMAAGFTTVFVIRHLLLS